MSSPVWQIRTTAEFDRAVRRLDRTIRVQVLRYLTRLAELPDPRMRGKALTGNHVGEWRYRVGDYRIIALVIDGEMVILALSVGHRSSVY